MCIQIQQYSLLLSFSKNILDTNNIHLYLPISFGFLIASKRISILADVIVVVIGSDVKILGSNFVIFEQPDLTLCLYICVKMHPQNWPKMYECGTLYLMWI